jgi:hypothetical protein
MGKTTFIAFWARFLTTLGERVLRSYFSTLQLKILLEYQTKLTQSFERFDFIACPFARALSTSKQSAIEKLLLKLKTLHKAFKLRREMLTWIPKTISTSQNYKRLLILSLQPFFRQNRPVGADLISAPFH